MAKKLTRLRIDEVSSVDRGAGEGVKIMLMKRDAPAKKDEPMSKIAKMFSKVFGGGDDNNITIDKSLEGLAESVTSILADENIDQGAALAKTFEQFGDHLKETLTAGPAVINKEVSNMDIKVLAKALGLAETATEAEVSKAITDQHAATVAATTSIKKMEHELRVAKADFSPAELEFYSKISEYDDEEKDEMGDGDPKGKGKPSKKKAFRLASKAERATIMKAAEPEMPAYVKKIMDDNAALRKRLDEMEGSSDLVSLTKRATEAGLPEAEGVTIQKALKGDREAVEKLLDFVKSATAVAKASGVFKEFGSSSGTGVVTTAYDELATLAKSLQKVDSKLSFPAAFAKVYEDPANIEIVKRERGENRPSV